MERRITHLELGVNSHLFRFVLRRQVAPESPMELAANVGTLQQLRVLLHGLRAGSRAERERMQENRSESE